MMQTIRRLALASTAVMFVLTAGASSARADVPAPPVPTAPSVSVPAAAPPVACAGLVAVNLGLCL